MDLHGPEEVIQRKPEWTNDVQNSTVLARDYYDITKSPIKSERMQAARNDFLRELWRTTGTHHVATSTGQEVTVTTSSNEHLHDNPVAHYCNEQDAMFLPQ